jgi:hypothetical protein
MRLLEPWARWHYCEVRGAKPMTLSTSRPSRRRSALAVAAVVLAAHALLLGRALPLPGLERGADGPRPLQVRQIVMAPVPVLAPVAVAAELPAIVRPRVGAAQRGARPAASPAPERTITAAAPAAAAAGDVHEAGGTPLPVYATRLPPAATLRYAVRRGASTGQAELRWRPVDGRYHLAMDGGGPAEPRLGSISQGRLDATGVVPERYTESRRGRETRAVNFQHESGRITFSGPSLHYPLLRGAQDRLSWMLQLPAVMEAEPALREPGSEVLMFVAGTRGDGEAWAFTVQGPEAVDTPGGLVPGALHLRRQPRRPYDTQVDVWLDPARHHLPVRLQLLLQPAGGGAEFLLEQYTAP